MKIKLLIISILTTIMFIGSTAYALDKINFMLPSRAGGATGGSAIALTEAMNENGAKTHIAFLGNCKLGKTVYTHNEDPFMMVLPATLKPKCGFGMEPTEDTFVKILTIEGLSIVKHKNRNDLGLEDFMNPNSSKTLGTSFSIAHIVQSWLDDRSDKAPIITFGNSGNTATASLSNDADYWILKNTYIYSQLERFEVIAVASETKQDWIDAPALGELDPSIRYPNLMFLNYAIIKNYIGEDKNAVIEVVLKATENDSFQTYISRPGMINVSGMDYKEMYDLVKKIQEPYFTLDK